jgi:DNA-binding SARP family transcriptional activator
MSALTIHLFGRFQVRGGDHDHLPIDGAKVQELFAYLLLHRRRSCRRETLAEVLWPDSSAAQARKYFRQTLWQLQVALGEDKPGRGPGRGLLLVELEWLRLDPAADIWLDVQTLESALDLTQAVAGRDLTASQAEAARAAVRVYGGDLLEAWPYEWCLYERERLLLGYLQLLDKLMGFCETHRAYDEAVEYAAQILRTDRGRERTHRNLMRLYYLAGDRAEALRQYARCTRALRDELDVAPSARTRALYDQILADRLEGPPLSASPSDIDGSVAALRSLLDGFDSHVRSAIQQLEHAARSRV